MDSVSRFGKILILLGLMFMDLGKLSLLNIAKYGKNDKAIRSHWLWPSINCVTNAAGLMNKTQKSDVNWFTLLG